MKPLCFSNIIKVLGPLAAVLLTPFVSATKGELIEKSAIVYYGDDISYSNVGIHDYIIVESENVSPYTHGFKTYKDKIYAYVSIGEAASYRDFFKDIDDDWKVATNDLWGSVVLDIGNEDYHHFLITQVIQPMIEKGYENFFFDTLDSYEIAVKSEKDREYYKQGLITFIKTFKQYFPESKLVINRGFEIIDDVHNEIDAMLIESIFYGLSNENLGYKKVSSNDREWLLSKLTAVKKYNIDIIGLDYIAANEEQKIDQTITDLKEMGFIPYIANKELNRYGKSSKNAIQRDVLVLTNTNEHKNATSALRLLAMPLEYQGYIPVIKKIEDGLPNAEQLSRYKAIVIWFEKDLDSDNHDYIEWLNIVKNSKKKILFMSGFGINDSNAIYELLSIKRTKIKSTFFDKKKIITKSPLLNFEAPVLLKTEAYAYQSSESSAFLQVKSGSEPASTIMAKTKWGGYALTDYAIRNLVDKDESQWVINPFSFLKITLELDDIPILDPTTENGRRLMFVHIDGDGSMNRVEWDASQYSIGVAYTKVLKKYKIPQSVSLVEGETSSEKGMYLEDAPHLEKIAKAIFRLPYVEAASHSYSHPFYWDKIEYGNLAKEHRLSVPNYKFSLKEEIIGSLKYIDNLQPKEKGKANLIFWTGDTNPNEEVLEYLYKHNIANINSGDTTITNDKPWLSLVSPFAIKHGEYIQTYTGAQNENVYTGEWTGPFWGFTKVIQTFKLTDSPRRLKPINIYYHFYAVSKTASIKALTNVYDWALNQKTMPIYTGEYIPKTLEFYDASIAKVSINKKNNVFYFSGLSHLKTFRAADNLGFLEDKNSQVVLGTNEHNGERYIHLNTQSKNTIVKFTQERSLTSVNFLEDTNAQVLNYKKTSKRITFQLESYVPIEINYHIGKGCKLTTDPSAKTKRTKQTKSGELHSLIFNEKVANVIIQCR